MPLHATAIGKALLSGVSDSELDRLLGEGLLRPYTRWTVVRPNLLREQLARLVPQRFARLYEEGTVNAASAWTDSMQERCWKCTRAPS